MALTSPGVEVTIIDESQYLPAPTNSVPLVVLATAQNKANATGTGVAAATTAANAGKLYQVTSQRDLVNLYGKPFFYSTTNGTPIQGYELNEYGLLAAYSLLGVTNRCYVLRADIDLASLVGQTGRPVGAPADGTYWLDTTTSTWGIYEFNSSTGDFTQQTPIVITDTSLMDNGLPVQSIGSIGDYAVYALDINTPPFSSPRTYYHKTTTNQWTILGSSAWRSHVPTIIGSNSPTSLNQGDTLDISLSGADPFTITVPLSPNNTVTGLADAINNLGFGSIFAANVDGRLNIYSNQFWVTGSTTTNITITSSTGTVVEDLGITQNVRYNQPVIQYGTYAQMPYWTASQANPRPTGSVWLKVGSSGGGLAPVVSKYSAATASWIKQPVGSYQSDWAATAQLDPTGGQAVPAGTIYGQYTFNGSTANSPYYLWKRSATGPTVVTGTATFESATAPVFNSGPYNMTINVSLPGSPHVSSPYYFIIDDGASVTDFITALYGSGVPYVNASAVAGTNAIQLTHTEGGEILLTDIDPNTGISSGLLAEIGIVPTETTGVKYGPVVSTSFYDVPVSSTTSASGANATFNVSTPGYYNLLLISDGGSFYEVGDQVTLSGADMGGQGQDLVLGVTSVDGGGAITGATWVSGTVNTAYMAQLSNWQDFSYTANEGAPAVAPANNTNWFYSVVDEVDIMVQKGGAWIGYQNTAYDSTGHPAFTGVNNTDPNGPIISASKPTTQSDGTPLEYGDLWIDTSDLEMYPVISRWQSVSNVDQWVLIDNTDQTSTNGVTFLDARWATNGTTSPIDDPIPTIQSLLTSNYLDLDAPSPSLYPQGMLLFNTRRSGYNVKQFRTNYFNNTSFPGQSLPEQTSAWVSVSGNQTNGAPYMGRKAQRAMVVESLRSVIDTNLSIRDEDNYFNLIATPNYPELQPNMVVLNADRGETAFIIGDTPLGLPDSATDIQAWANNDAGASSTGEEGLVTRNTYLGLFYPSGIANDLDGNEVVVPASHMMLRTFLRNDTIAYPWLAAAGTRRGNIDNALNIGYLDRTTGEFQAIKTRIGIRDVLYINQINPLVFFTGVGLLNYGNKTSYNSSSALDRTNVARLVNYVRRQLTLAARPFVFEPNDALTRNQIAGVVQTLMVDLVAKRGIYDYLVVCDESNNTPARIDRNELWVNVAIEPVKAAEFIYIPVRVLNTGEIATLSK